MNLNGDGFLFLWIIWFLLIAIVNIAFAVGVFMDADLMKRRINEDTFLVSKVDLSFGDTWQRHFCRWNLLGNPLFDIESVCERFYR